MKTIYFIDITNGIITFDAYKPRANNPNAKQYFKIRYKAKPSPIKVKGWPFKNMYITGGDEKNGYAMAWS